MHTSYLSTYLEFRKLFLPIAEKVPDTHRFERIREGIIYDINEKAKSFKARLWVGDAAVAG